MIKANELRIGNWILPQHDLDGEYHKVFKIEGENVNGYKPEWYSPILLTPEILEQYGMSNSSNWLCIQLFSDLIFHVIIKHQITQHITDIAQIKYVHQLQNFYFALTGEELKFTQSILTK